ncbi:unnamed protein product [Mytilus coruscus]|uniref:AIG1-type G domain-containing protein n=1 Tax=Mytilus coruscus TaxID=42192 RepID=A0A6J8C866_MYTCO|nr:unnamed protein product [Mytilus coruscus]
MTTLRMSTAIMSRPTRNTDGCQLEVTRHGRFRNITSNVFKRNGHYEMLLRELEINSLLPIFRRSLVLTDNELSKIKQQTHRRRRVAEFLEIMFDQPTEAWIDKVLLILEENEHCHVVRQLQGLRELFPPNQIRIIRPVQYQLRVVLEEDDMVRDLQRVEDSQILDDALEYLDFSILNIYDGSLCFLLDPVSEQAINELWQKSKNIPKIKKFLGRILARFRTRQSFANKREIRVEISEIEDDFLIRVDDHAELNDLYTIVEKKPKQCSGCFRQTVLGNYQTILDEIETSMMEETFKTDIVPGCIKKACIDEKDKRSRLERADIFLQFVLTNEKLLMAFKRIYEKSSEVAPKPMYCGPHSLETELIKDTKKHRETIELCFVIHYEAKDDNIVISSATHEFRNSWPNLDLPDKISKSEYAEIEKSISSGKRYEEVRIVVAGKGSFIKTEITEAILGDGILKSQRYGIGERELALGTTQLQRGRTVDKMFEKVFTVTTTPDISGSPLKALRDEILKFLTMTSPGPHIVILAVNSSLRIEYENFDDMLKPFMDVFGEQFQEYIVLALEEEFSHRTSLFSNSPICKKLVQKNRILYLEYGRRRLFVSDMLSFIEKIQRQTKVSYFSNPLYERTEQVLRLKSLEQYDTQLEEVREQETEIALLREKLIMLEGQRKVTQGLDTRESAIEHFNPRLLRQSLQHEIDKETSTCNIL